MKTCPNCKAEVDDNFEICWNCQYNFADSHVMNEAEFAVVCPQCQAEVDSKMQFCPYCKHDLNSVVELDKHGISGATKQIDCLRCKVPMLFNGNYRFHEGTRMGVFGDLAELFTNRESFDLYYCPACGKVEFFLPDMSL